MWVEVVRNRFSHGAALALCWLTLGVCVLRQGWISVLPKFMTGCELSKKELRDLHSLVLSWSPFWCFLMHAASVLFFPRLSHATAHNFVERML